MTEIIKIFWLFLPAGMANIAPTLFKWVPTNCSINEKVFGKNKTYRGFVVGVIFSMATIYIESLFLDYSYTNIWILGFLMGFGALLGDLVFSFFKRRKNIDPGKPWVPFDQIDWIIGAVILSYFYINLSFLDIFITLILFGIFHPIINLLGYFLKIKKNKF